MVSYSPSRASNLSHANAEVYSIYVMAEVGGS